MRGFWRRIRRSGDWGTEDGMCWDWEGKLDGLLSGRE